MGSYHKPPTQAFLEKSQKIWRCPLCQYDSWLITRIEKERMEGTKWRTLWRAICGICGLTVDKHELIGFKTRAHNYPILYWGILNGEIPYVFVDYIKMVDEKGKPLFYSFPQWYQDQINVIMKRKKEEMEKMKAQRPVTTIETPKKFDPATLKER